MESATCGWAGATIAGSSSVRLTRYDGAATDVGSDTFPTLPSVFPQSASGSPYVVTGDDDTVDILVAFNGTMTNFNIWAFAQTCIDQAQLAMDSSTSPGSIDSIAQLRLAGAARVPRTDIADPEGDVDFIETNPGGIAAHAYWSADIVVMISPGTGAVIGFSDLPGFGGRPPPGPAFAPYAVAAVLRDFATTPGQYVFAHELAHVFGANHNKDHGTPNPTPLAPYAFGRWARNPVADPGGVHRGYRTIMSYLDECTGNPCPRILYYSNPDVTYDWFITGLPNSANNARLISEVAPIHAQNYADLGRILADGFE